MYSVYNQYIYIVNYVNSPPFFVLTFIKSTKIKCSLFVEMDFRIKVDILYSEAKLPLKNLLKSNEL